MGGFFDDKINSDSRNDLSNSVFGHLIFDEMKLKTGVQGERNRVSTVFAFQH
jgi:hypothetical protein